MSAFRSGKQTLTVGETVGELVVGKLVGDAVGFELVGDVVGDVVGVEEVGDAVGWGGNCRA